MNEGLDAAAVLEAGGGKPSKQYRTSRYTVRDYCALPYAQRVAVDAECDALAGIERTAYADETSVQPYTVGRATQKVKGAQPAPLPSTTSQSPPAMTTAYVHPAPSPALHTLNSPELIDHNAAHPDSLATYATPAPRNVADLLDVVSRYVTLTERVDETEWTHWGPSPFLRGDTHSFAVNIAEGLYKCFTSFKTGDVVDFIMFMEELNEAEALAWLKANFPNHYETSTPAASAAALEADQDEATGDFAHTPAALSAALGEAARPLATLAEAVGLAATVSPPAAPVAHTGTVYETTNYDLFRLLPENRVVDPGHVRKLMAQISERNLLRSQPLEVTADMGLLDGQHRLAAARELGLPVYYKVGEQLSEEDITALNMARKNWQATDYLHMWTTRGKPSYVAFSEFQQRHPRISFSNTKILLSSGSRAAGADEFRRGLWNGAASADMALADKVAGLVERIADEVPTFKQAFHTGFVGALYHCATKVQGFEAKELLRTILAQPLSLLPCASHKQWLEMLGRIYNYRKKTDENRLRFE